VINPANKNCLEGDLAGFARQTHLRIAAGARAPPRSKRPTPSLGCARTRGRRSAIASPTPGAPISYPRSASVHTHAPAVQVYTKAPKIVAAFGATRSIRGQTRAISGDPDREHAAQGAPQGRDAGRGRGDVQSRSDFDPRPRPTNACVRRRDQSAKSGKGFRRAMKRRTKDGRRNEMILMFVMVRQVGLEKKLNWKADFCRSRKSWKVLFPAEIAKALSAGSN
jgi:hypothetical protein